MSLVLAETAQLSVENLLAQGMRLQRIGRWAEAEALYRHALAEQPNSVASACLASVLHDRAAYPPALEHYARALALHPAAPALHGDRGIAFRAQGDVAAAIASAERALDFDADNGHMLSNLGNALRDAGRLADAEAALDRAIARTPDLVEAWDNRASVRLQRGAVAAAVADFEEALARAPTRAPTWYNQGNAWKKAGRLATAIACYQRARALQPGLLAAHHNLGHALQDLGDVDGAISAYRGALAIDPGFAVAHSNLVFAQLYDHRLTGRDLLAEHAAWGTRHGHPAQGQSVLPRRAQRSRLRIGYVSPDLCHHSVCYFAEPVLESHDRDAVEVYCYAEVAEPDEVSARFRRAAHAWRSTVGMTDDAVAELIRTDGIDVLVDLAGHTGNNRLQVFARRPAPLQVAWLGYPFSTGVATIDAMIGDDVLTPPDMPALEQLWRLPRPWICYRAPSYAPEPAPRAVPGAGQITFGSFSNLAKLNDEVIAAWAAILIRLPKARLLLNNRWLADPVVRERFIALFRAYGVEGRIDLVATAPHDVTLARYGTVDIALDPFPFNGLTVTCEALWAGVPVVTLAAQDRPVGRMGAALLAALGLGHLSASSLAGYIETAVALAHDLDSLQRLRAGLRPAMVASALGDGRSLARGLEQAYRGLLDGATKDGATKDGATRDGATRDHGHDR